jgi:hypothetical protein
VTQEEKAKAIANFAFVAVYVNKLIIISSLLFSSSPFDLFFSSSKPPSRKQQQNHKFNPNKTHLATCGR